MKNKNKKEICPTCGQTMNLVKPEDPTKDISKLKKDEDDDVEPYDISEIWHCLNCSDEWQSDIKRNVWRKNEISE